MPRTTVVRQLRAAAKQLGRAAASAHAQEQYDVAEAAHELELATLMLLRAAGEPARSPTGVDRSRRSA